MEERKLRDERIQRLITVLLGPTSLKAEEALNLLSLYFQRDDIESVYRILSQKGDSQSIYWLVRYLVNIECPSGFEKLFLLAQNENEFIRQEARSGISRINPDQRVELLLKMLKFDREDDICFALKELAKLKLPKAVVPILDVLKKNRQNENICIFAVRALGSVGDRQSFIALERLADAQKGKVQEEILLSLGRLTRRIHFRSLRRFLSSKNARIREIAYRRAAELQQRRSDYCLTQGLSTEGNELLKLNILSWISSILTKKLFQAIFATALNDPSPRVRMMARSAIRRAKSARTLRYITNQNRHEKNKWAKVLLLRLMADYHRVSSVAKIFKKEYINSKEPLVKLSAIESLGQIKDQKSIPFLWQVIIKRDSYSYAASVSLGCLVDRCKWDLVDEVLALNQDNHSLTIQIFLGLILRLRSGCAVPQDVVQHIEKLTTSDFPHIRYVAQRCFAKLSSSSCLHKVLLWRQNDKMPFIKEGCTRSLTEILQKEPNSLIQLLSECTPQSSRLLSSYYVLLKKVHISVETFTEVVKKLLELACKSIQAQGQVVSERNFYVARLMVLLRVLAIKERTFFLEYLKRTPMGDTERWVMVRVINRTDIHEYHTLSIEFMAQQYQHSSIETKLEYLDFFKKLSAENRQIEQAVFEDLYRENNGLVRKKVNAIISRWTEKAAQLYK